MIGKLEPADLRDLWKHEALNFTSWLADNCDVLKDQLGLDLTVVEKEKSVGRDGRLLTLDHKIPAYTHVKLLP
jgi:hypothetical protein